MEMSGDMPGWDPGEVLRSEYEAAKVRRDLHWGAADYPNQRDAKQLAEHQNRLDAQTIRRYEALMSDDVVERMAELQLARHLKYHDEQGDLKVPF